MHRPSSHNPLADPGPGTCLALAAVHSSPGKNAWSKEQRRPVVLKEQIAVMEPRSDAFLVAFPGFSSSILQKLNQQRKLGQLCDITVVIQGYHYRAHRAVLAAGSPYFCDQVLLKSSARVVLPDIMRPSVFESLLQSCYTGTLRLPPGDLVGFLTAASFLQMWHVVDKCTELLGGQRPQPSGGPQALGDGSQVSPVECPGGASHGGSGDKFPDYGHGGMALEQALGAVDSPMSEPELPAAEESGFNLEGEDGDVWLPYTQASLTSHSECVQVVQEDIGSLSRADANVPQMGLPTSASSSGAEVLEETFKEEGVDKVLKVELSPEDEFPVDKAKGPPAGGQEDDFIEVPDSSQVKQINPGKKNFTHKSQRDRNMRGLLGPRPYGCSVCGKTFEMKHHLVCHVKSHVGAGPFRCSACRRRFVWRDSFSRHVLECSGEAPGSGVGQSDQIIVYQKH
ncbi:hypothetical protein GN956_G23508 [Arapaima gigas]